MKHWFIFDFNAGKLQYIGVGRTFDEADELTGGVSGWLFDLESLKEFAADATRMVETFS